jgi:zinc-ribbon domain
METRCQKCGEPVGVDQAFCPRCGAVVGMADAGEPRGDEGWELETTMLGRKSPPKPAPRAVPAADPPQAPASRAQQAPRGGGSTSRLAVIGFAAVLLVGLLLLLLYLNSR